MTQPVSPEQRHRGEHRCPICGGRDEDARGRGRRCSGYTSSDGEWVRCSREEHAGFLAPDDHGLYVHRMRGSCNCGEQHGPLHARTFGDAGGDIDATYDYRDECGALLFQVVRFAGKKFRQRRPDGGGGWEWRLNGVRRVLYRLPEIIAADMGAVIYIVEGEKDVDALARRGLVATCNPGGAGKWRAVREQAREVLVRRSIVIIPDADAVGRAHAQQVAASLHDVAERVALLELGQHDVSDWLCAGGTAERLSELAAGAAEYSANNMRRVGTAEVVLLDDERDRRPTDNDVVLVPGRESPAVDKTIALLARGAPGIYQRAGLLVRITREEAPADGSPASASPPRISVLPSSLLQEWIDAVTELGEAKHDEVRAIHPPSWFVAQVADRGEWPGIRRLEGVTQCPVVRPDGTVIELPGYDGATGLYYAPNFAPLELRGCPLRDDALAALAELRDIIRDFPFAAPEHEAGYLALLLTPFARYAFRGPAPLGVLDGSVAGVGKGKLVQIISMLIDGCEVSPTPQPEEPEEETKLITSVALAGRKLVLIDNATRPVGSGPLEALLTSTRWSARILGANKTFDGDVLTQWILTGNNVAFRKKDTIRRTVHVRVESQSPNPEARTDFAHPDLLEWVRRERARLVRAALTILRAHALAEYPNPCAQQWGSFEGWSDRVRAALVWLGMADPASTRAELARSADTEGRALVVVLETVRRACALGNDGVTARELLDMARSSDDLKDAIDELCPTRRGDVTPKALGYQLRAAKRRVVEVDGEPLALDSCSGPRHSTLWRAITPG